MGPSREACDRCHAMKTRCVRLPQSPVCVRCTRLGFSCHHSPPGRTGRPAGRRQGKNAASRKKPAPRSSSTPYQNGPVCFGEHCPTTTTGTITSPMLLPGQVSPALTADDATNSQQSGNFSDLDIFGSNPAALSDSASPVCFMDDLFQDVLSSHARASAGQAPTIPPSIVSQDPLEELFSNVSSSSRSSFTPSPQDTEFLLLDAQAQLLRLVRALSSCSRFPQDVDDTYRITDNFVKAVDGIAAMLDASSPGSRPWGGSATYMLLSSCYMSLIQAFECLVGLLRRELGPEANNFDSSPLGINLPPQQPPPVPHAMTANLPYMVGASNVRVPMPHRAVAEINLHLVGQAVQHLKASIARCAAKAQPGMELGSWHQSRTWDGYSPICVFTSIALDNLELQEQSLFSRLQIPVLQ